MGNTFDPFEPLKRHQQSMNKIFNSPAIQGLRNQQHEFNKIFNTGVMQDYRKQQNEFNKLFKSPVMQTYTNQQNEFNKLFKSAAMQTYTNQQNEFNNLFKSPVIQTYRSQHYNFNKIFNSLGLHVLQGHQDTYNKVVKNLNLNISHNFNKTIFDDIAASIKSASFKEFFQAVTLEDLTVFDEIINEIDSDTFNYSPQQTMSPGDKTNLVGDMTRDELRKEIADAFETTQLAINTKDTPVKEKIRSLFDELITSLGIDLAKNVIGHIFSIFFAMLLTMTISNHDLDVVQILNEKFSENDSVATIRKVFVKDSKLEQPINELAFLRTASNLRTRPSKKSHFVPDATVPKNMVVIPTMKNGNWILVEVEIEGDFYTGWVEESKVINFKREKRK